MLADDEDVLEISRLTGNKQYTDKTLGRTRWGGFLVWWTPRKPTLVGGYFFTFPFVGNHHPN